MKSRITALLFLVFTVCACSVVSTPGLVIHGQGPDPSTPVVTKILSSTGALVLPGDEEHTSHVYCTAVWLSKTKLLTANHCVEGSEEAHYFVPEESAGPHEEPFAMHLAKVLKTHEVLDLALVQALGPVPEHAWVHLAPREPAVGSHLWVAGHPSGMTWTLSQGIVAAYRESQEGPNGVSRVMQVSAPVWFGNSGGGAFNDEGELTGIASYIMKAPQVSFFVPADTIREFLRESP